MSKMKKINYLTSILGVLLILLAYACKKEETPVDNTPVLDVNFFYEVNAHVVTFTTTLTGNVWWTESGSGTDYTAVNQEAEVEFAEAGTYTFTCSVLDEGETLTSTPFDVVVEIGDTSVYAAEYWINLTGGYNKSKTWVLDVDAKVLPGPLSFMGTAWDFVLEENVGDDAWLWDADLNFTFEDDSANVRMDWPGEEGYGSMTFDLINGKNFTADKKKTAAESGTYVLDWDTRTLTITGATILHDYKPFAVVDGVVVDGKTGISDWNNYKIYDLTDTLLRLAVSRDQDVHGEGVCWLIYNFVETNIYESIVVEQPKTYEAPVLSSFTAADLEGTWIYDQVAQDWIGWVEEGSGEGGKRLNGWTTRADMASTLEGWGASNPDSVFTANDAKEFVFNNDLSCTLAGVANTYSVTDGVITFGTALTDELSLVWISITGTEAHVLDVQYDNNGDPYTYEGIWIGVKNGDKDESSAVHLIKKP
jgi:hypothetical protein